MTFVTVITVGDWITIALLAIGGLGYMTLWLAMRPRKRR